MKKLVIITAATFVFAAAGYAQTSEMALRADIKSDDHAESSIKKEKREERKALRKLEGNEVSYQSRQAFYLDFGKIAGTQWESLRKFDRATFTKNGHEMEAFYDSDSKLVGTTTAKTFSDLPAKARKYIDTKYPDYDKVAVTYFDDNEYNETDMILYNQQFQDADNYFIELKKGDKKIVLKVDMLGNVFFFTSIK